MKQLIKLEYGFGGRIRGKTWAKVVEHVDTSKTNGFAFEGDFVKLNQLIEIEVPCWLLKFSDEGSVKYHEPVVALYRVNENGKLEEKLRAEGRDWALQLRDRVAELINKEEKVNPLANYSDEELLAEIKRRELI